MRVGVLALQGDFQEHIQVLKSLGVDTVEIRKPEQLRDVHALVIPGGESTTFAKLALEYGLLDPIREMCRSGKPVWGTCAGMILLARDAGRPQPVLGVLDVKVQRNAFGRQVNSFEVDLDVPELAKVQQNGATPHPFHAIFIRAPLIESAGKGVDILARLEDGTIVAARQDNLLATSFHPELTHDARFHQYFIEMIQEGKKKEER